MKKILLALIMLLSFTTGANIVPDNDMYIPINTKSTKSQITEKKFNAIMDRMEAIYAPIICERGKTLEVIRKWEDGTVNAYAQQTGDIWKVSMFGGLARHKAVTADGFALVVCHELGHHLGGAPKNKSWWGTSWASNEGQADWWGNAKCMRKYFEADDNIAIMANVVVPELAITTCKKSFAGEQLAMCKRGAMAGMSLANLFKDLRRLPKDLRFNTPDTTVVTKTYNGHPAPQCRLDTYFAGAVCGVDAYTDVNDTDANIGTCNRTYGDEIGLRPLCWYKP